MCPTTWDSDLLQERNSDLELFLSYIPFDSSLFVFTKSNNTVVTLQSAFWCSNVVSHIKESEVASFFPTTLDLNSSPQGEVVSFQTADFHGCTVTSIQPQKLFRGLSVSARCTYCQWGNQKREESSYTEWRRVVLLQMCGYTIVVSTYPILPFQKESGMTGFSQRHLKNVKRHARFPNPRRPNLNLETASYLTVLKGYRAVVLVLNTAHSAFQVLLVLQFGALWVLWHCLFRRENDSLRELLLPGQHCPCKHKSETEAHTSSFTHNPVALWTIPYVSQLHSY